MHSNARLWTIAVIALALGVIAGGAAISLAQRGKVEALQSSLAQVTNRLNESDRTIEDLTDQLNQKTETPPAADQGDESPSTDTPQKRSFAFVKSVSPGSPGRIVVDYADYLTGEAAAKAATKAGEESPPPNDYFIVNKDEKTAALKLAADATIALTTRPGEGSVVEGYTTDVATFAGYLSADTEETVPLRVDGYWLTVADGVVIAVEEQYAP